MPQLKRSRCSLLRSACLIKAHGWLQPAVLYGRGERGEGHLCSGFQAASGKSHSLSFKFLFGWTVISLTPLGLRDASQKMERETRGVCYMRRCVYLLAHILLRCHRCYQVRSNQSFSQSFLAFLWSSMQRWNGSGKSDSNSAATVAIRKQPWSPRGWPRVGKRGTEMTMDDGNRRWKAKSFMTNFVSIIRKVPGSFHALNANILTSKD